MTKYIPKPMRANLLGKPLLGTYEVLERINNINTYHTKRDKALISFLFLSGCRISEVCKFIKNKQIVGEPIKKIQIIIREKEDFMEIEKVRTLKRNQKNKSKKDDMTRQYKDIPIVISKDIEFYRIFKEYYDILKEDDFLFNITRVRCYQILQNSGLFNHYMRHLRATNLVKRFHLNAQQLKQFFNWSSSVTADNYTHLDTEDLRNKMSGK